MLESTKEKYENMEGQFIGRYKILKFENKLSEKTGIIKFKVLCNRCGWIGIVSIRGLMKGKDINPKKCNHLGGLIHCGDKYGKYTIIKKAPSKLGKNDVLYPYYLVKCNKCGKKTIVSKGTLIKTKMFKTSEFIECKHMELK